MAAVALGCSTTTELAGELVGAPPRRHRRVSSVEQSSTTTNTTSRRLAASASSISSEELADPLASLYAGIATATFCRVIGPSLDISCPLSRAAAITSLGAVEGSSDRLVLVDVGVGRQASAEERRGARQPARHLVLELVVAALVAAVEGRDRVVARRAPGCSSLTTVPRDLLAGGVLRLHRARVRHPGGRAVHHVGGGDGAAGGRRWGRSATPCGSPPRELAGAAEEVVERRGDDDRVERAGDVARQSSTSTVDAAGDRHRCEDRLDDAARALAAGRTPTCRGRAGCSRRRAGRPASARSGSRAPTARTPTACACSAR